jgi:hypothetical protein
MKFGYPNHQSPYFLALPAGGFLPIHINQTFMQTYSLESFMSTFGYTNIKPVLNRNENGYPFLTFISQVNGANIAENIYFSKGAALLCPEGVGVSLTAEFITSFQVAITVNGDGEERIKLTRKGANNWLSLTDLFG